MNADELLRHYERIADASEAVARLRRFVLDLAVRGKLVPQDPRDEPASELVKKIVARKLRATNTRTSRRTNAADSKISEVPFALPRSWEWVTLGTAFDYDAGAKREPNELDPNLWLLELEDVEKETGRILNRLRVSDRTSQSTKSEFQTGDILYGKLRPYLNKVVVADERGYSTTEIVAIRPYGLVCADYCALALRRPDFVAFVSRVGQGTKMPRLRTEDAVAAPIPLPPLAEQRRIVAKVDELMALCDRLEAARAQREAARDRLARSCLARLDTPDPETFREDARFALDALPALTARPDQIKQLRQTILNLAVRGKLLPQDPNDEPTPKLLKQLAARRAMLIAGGTVPPQEPAVRDASRLTGSLPSSWIATALGELCTLVTSGSRGWADFYSESGAEFIRAQNIRFGMLRLDDLAFVNPPSNSEGSRTQVARGDLLVVITGAGVTNPALLDCDLDEAYVSQHVALLRPIDVQFSRWLLLCLMAPAGGRDELVERAYGSGKPGLNLDNIRSLSVPLPPLAEQHRIVAKVDELMALCDRLEASLEQADAHRRRLLEALLHQALEPAAALEEQAA